MIIYDFTTEAWIKVDSRGYQINDGSFFVTMTPEVKEDCEMTFFSEIEFWKWYNS
jgi:hypothetical protein